MEVLKETTEWNASVYNHTYVLVEGRLAAYRSAMNGEFSVFPKSMHFDKNGRKFVPVFGDELEDIVMTMPV